MEEIWKDIEGFEGLYQVSNLGRVRSLNYRCKGETHIIKLLDNTDGYKTVGLYKDKVRKFFRVHRLVAKAFLGDWSEFCPVINHKDENPSNNRVDNLEWCTHKYNLNYGTAQERKEQTRLKNGNAYPELVGLDKKERSRMYYYIHKEENQERSKKYYQEHKEKFREYMKKYKEEHRDESRRKAKEYYQKHKKGV